MWRVNLNTKGRRAGTAVRGGAKHLDGGGGWRSHSGCTTHVAAGSRSSEAAHTGDEYNEHPTRPDPSSTSEDG